MVIALRNGHKAEREVGGWRFSTGEGDALARKIFSVLLSKESENAKVIDGKI